MEGVEIVTEANYDFAYINKAAKQKFIKPKPKFKNLHLTSPTAGNLENWWFQKNSSGDQDRLNEEMASSLVDDLFSDYYPDSANSYLKKVVSKSIDPNSLYKELIRNLDDQETLWLSFTCHTL